MALKMAPLVEVVFCTFRATRSSPSLELGGIFTNRQREWVQATARELQSTSDLFDRHTGDHGVLTFDF